jgi:hypothetical protein
MFKRYTHTAVALALLACGASAGAGVLRLGQRGDLAQAGQVLEVSNFDDFGAGYHFPGSGFTRGGVQYNSDDNLIVGAGTGWSIGQARPMLTNERWSPIVASIVSALPTTVFGFDAAVSGGSVDLVVATNLGSYRFEAISLRDGANAADFLGFQATGGEYFTGFALYSMGEGYLAGITDIALGGARTALPEPGGLGLLLAGLGLLARARAGAGFGRSGRAL